MRKEGLSQVLSYTSLFILLQIKEYIFAFFTISDSMFGSSFYFGTGLHGIHVSFALLGYSFLFNLILQDKIFRDFHLFFKI